MTRLEKLIDENDRALARLWKKREWLLDQLLKSTTRVRKLERSVERQRKLLVKQKQTRKMLAELEAADLHRATAEPAPAIGAGREANVDRPGTAVDDGIPDFLRREQVKAEVASAKKDRAAKAALKRKVRAQMQQADLTGATRRTPLSGREAVALINK